MFKKYFSFNIASSDFAKNVATLFTGTAIAQALTIAVSVLLSRLYTPAEFGDYALYISIVAGVSIVICGRFELAIILPKEDDEALKIVNLALVLSFLFSFLFLMIVIVLILIGKVSLVFILAPISSFLIGNFQVLNNYFLRKKAFKTISRGRIFAALSNSILSLLFGIVGVTKLGLIFSHSLSSLFTNFTFTAYLNTLSLSFKSKMVDLKQTFKKYNDFIKYNALQALSDMLVINGIFYVIPLFYEKYILGLFSFAIRILQAPMSLIGSSIAQVFFQEAAKNKNENISNKHLVLSTIKKSALIILPMPIIMLIFGPSIFAITFGEKWRMSGELARMLSIWIYFDFIRATISQLPIVLNKQKSLLAISIFGNVILFTSIFYFGQHHYSILDCFKYLCILMSIFTVSIILWIYSISLSHH